MPTFQGKILHSILKCTGANFRLFKIFFRLVKVKWGKELYNEVDLNTDDEPVLFKAQLYALTGVQPHRQKVMVKGAVIKDESWENVANKIKNGATLLLMGSKGIVMFQMNVELEIQPAPAHF